MNIKEIIKETEKAICLKATITEEITDQSITRNVWFPKSMINKEWWVVRKMKEVVNDVAMANGGCYFVECGGEEFGPF